MPQSNSCYYKKYVFFLLYTVICSIFLWRIHIEVKDSKLTGSNKILYPEIKQEAQKKKTHKKIFSTESLLLLLL